MSRKKLIDTEIRALESELLGHIDDQIASLTALAGGMEKEHWLAGNGNVTLKEIQAFARKVNDDVVVGVVFCKDNVVEYVKRHYTTDYLLLSNRFSSGDFSDQTFDYVLESAVLNADCIFSKINFLNRLRVANLLHLDESVSNLCNPFSDEQLQRFKNICYEWLRVWNSNSGNPQDMKAMTSDQSAVINFGMDMKYWIQTVASVTDSTRASQVLLNAYTAKMSHFEALREKLDNP